MTLTVRRATPLEARRLTDIAHAAKRYWNYPERWIVTWRDALTVSPAEIERHEAHVGALAGTIAGFYLIKRVTAGWELEHMWVHPSYMGRGVGRTLFHHAARLVQARSADTLYIDADPHAAGFYLRMGARRIGATPAPMPGADRRQLPRLAYRTQRRSRGGTR